MSLRQLGFSLEEIRDCLGLTDYSLEKVLELHVARLADQVERGRVLRDRLGSSRPVTPGSPLSLGAMYQAEGPGLLDKHGMHVAPGVWDYMAKAVSALKST